jgi:broad specificity phosphatase PhoE
MQLFIRHGNDHTESKYKHDNELNSYYNNDVISLTYKLIKKYGCPKYIYCSPFQRSIQTVEIMEQVFKKLHKKVKILVDARLSRFFNAQEQLHPSVKKNTLYYNPPIYETKEAFNKRVKKVNYYAMNNIKSTWYITHYLVLKRIAYKHDIPIPEQMPFLHVFKI